MSEKRVNVTCSTLKGQKVWESSLQSNRSPLNQSTSMRVAGGTAEKAIQIFAVFSFFLFFLIHFFINVTKSDGYDFVGLRGMHFIHNVVFSD